MAPELDLCAMRPGETDASASITTPPPSSEAPTIAAPIAAPAAPAPSTTTTTATTTVTTAPTDTATAESTAAPGLDLLGGKVFCSNSASHCTALHSTDDDDYDDDDDT